MTSITAINDDDLVKRIDSATHRVAFVAPGVSDVVADALCRAWVAHGSARVHVTLDADAEVCRFGYGTLNALQRLRAAAQQIGAMVTHHPGVRIGILVCDNETVVFSPTPLLIEAGARAPNQPNGIVLAIAPDDIVRELGLGANGERDRTVGLDAIRPELVHKVEQDLAKAPPAKFDLARRMRVFNMHFQFVEIEMTGCSLSRRKVPIPPHLVGFTRDGAINERVTAQYSLLTGGQLRVGQADGKYISEDSLQADRKEIEDRFLIRVFGFGSVLHKGNKETFIRAIEELRSKIALFHAGAVEQIGAQLRASEDALVDALRDAVRTSPPEKYTRVAGPRPSAEFLEAQLRTDIAKALGTAEAVVSAMKLRVVFKDLAYESLDDESFRSAAERAGLNIAALHHEHDASRADAVEHE